MDQAHQQLAAPLRFDRARELGISRRELEGDGYIRVRRGLYLEATVDPGEPSVRARVAAEVARDIGHLGGWAAARSFEEESLGQLGERDELRVFDGLVPWPDGRGEQERLLVLIPRCARLTASPGVRVVRSDLEADEVVTLDGLRITAPLRTAFDLARTRSLRGGVIAIDRLASLGVINLEEFRASLGRYRGVPGVRRAREVAALADGRAESPPESVTRMIWLDAGLPRPQANVEVRDGAERFVARVDLLDPRSRLAVEYDGAHHATAAQRSRDSARELALEALGYIVVKVTAADLATPGARRLLQRRLRQAYRRALSLQGA